ncbi:helix-turn-helix transcriptional regulator [Streptomyces sp. Y7]|uniref:helix-turn-helix transcriptional regulator n=1 Tax=Streptomyces sp. Y7 TaxID=3342392 RepID=UPI003716D72A
MERVDGEHSPVDLPSPPQPDSASALFWRNLFSDLFDRLPMLVAICTDQGIILWANAAWAAEWGLLAGSLRGSAVCGFLRPETPAQLRSIEEAVRLHRRSRYPVSVRWTTARGVERRGEMIVEMIEDATPGEPKLLLTVQAEIAAPDQPSPVSPAGRVTETESRILALTAGGATTAQIASLLGLTPDGVNYHLKHMSRRWGVSGKPALVARAYVEGVLDPGHWPPASRQGTAHSSA